MLGKPNLGFGFMGAQGEQQYLRLLQTILDFGAPRGDRTGVGTLGIFGAQLRFDLDDGFPLLTTKKVFTKGIIHELLWFLSGDTNIEYLVKNGVHIWDEWAHARYLKCNDPMSLPDFAAKVRNDHEFALKWGDLGPVYGWQWRNFGYIPEKNAQGAHYEWEHHEAIPGIDQIVNLIDGLKRDPNGRRHIVSAWNPRDIPKMALPPCHCLFQFFVANNRLSCQLYQRSCDVFLGVPFNIASYSLLTMMVAQSVGLEPGEFIWVGGDTHLYQNHLEQARLQMTRAIRPFPTMKIRKAVDIFSYKYEDFTLENYDPHPTIAAPIAV